MRTRSTLVAGLAILLTIASLLSLSSRSVQSQEVPAGAEIADKFAWLALQHGEAAMERAGGGTASLPIGWTGQFFSSGYCNICHAYDSAGVGSVDALGRDVNMIDDWRSTMMANSTRDPFWRAKVSHEVLVNPVHQVAIEDRCTSCHAPMGHYAAKMDGLTHYSMADMLADPVALDGVSCSACHMISDRRLGSQHSGAIEYDTLNRIFGPYDTAFVLPMQVSIGQSPVFGEQILDAGLCASCHTLITESVDLSGNFTGGTFVEQATYHEWLNSRYETEQISCQNCHMPRIEDSVLLSGLYPFTERRSPYGLHELAGANTFMLELMKDNAEALGIPALPHHFDSTIAATYRMLQHRSLELELTWEGHDSDTAYCSLLLRNLAGHKFPSGYPSRRLFVSFVMLDGIGDTLFVSGRMDASRTLPDEDSNFEPHWDVIRSEDQVQIYELVGGDVNGDFTTVLVRMAEALKDNRLPPQGFLQTDPVYDTTRIVGAALNDADFNREDGIEGSGTDEVRFHVPISGYTGPVEIRAEIWYQSLPPRWMEEIFGASTPEIDTFKAMYYDRDPAPVLVSSDHLDGLLISSGLGDLPAGLLTVYPGISADGTVYLRAEEGLGLLGAEVYDLSGALRSRIDWGPGGTSESSTLQLPAASGLYLLRVQTTRGMLVRKVIRR
jgi:hypothetical protein